VKRLLCLDMMYFKYLSLAANVLLICMILSVWLTVSPSSLSSVWLNLLKFSFVFVYLCIDIR
jgi:hypothetical protein